MRHRETRECWPLLSVETEVNGDSKGTTERGHSLIGSLDLSCRYKGILPYFGCSIRPSNKIFLSPSPSKLGTRQASVLGRLSFSLVCVSVKNAQKPADITINTIPITEKSKTYVVDIDCRNDRIC